MVILVIMPRLLSLRKIFSDFGRFQKYLARVSAERDHLYFHLIIE